MKREPILAALALACGASLARADFVVSGRFLYRDRAFTYASGFTGAEPSLPVRLASVEVVDDATGQLLALGQTDQSGDFAILVPGGGTKDVVVRAISASSAFGPPLRVTDLGGTLYSVSSSVFAGHDQSVDLDVGTVTAGKVFAGSDQANPFNMLDMLVLGIEYLKSLGETNPSATITMRWPGGGGSFASGFTATMADDDGYDDCVQLHELGHVLHNMYSDSDSPGGGHSFGQSDQDPRLSFGEGWASFFAGAVRRFAGEVDPGIYVDAQGGAGGFPSLRMRFENGNPFTGTTGGEADEGAVFCALWDVLDDTATADSIPGDDDPIDGSFLFESGLDSDGVLWDVFTGNQVGFATSLTIRNFWQGFFQPLDHGRYDELDAAFSGWKMRFHLDAAEPNNSIAEAAPIAVDGGWTAPRSLYFSTADPPSPGNDDSDFYSFHIDATAVFEVETRYPAGKSDAETYCDPSIRLRRPNGSLFGGDDDSGAGRNALLTDVVADQTGTWTVEVFTDHGYRKTGSYEVAVRILAPAFMDCNGNQIGDHLDVANGTSADVDVNGVPDECQELAIDVLTLQTVFGGTQTLSMDVGPAHGGELYWILGSFAGTSPGVPVDGLLLPLNVDGYTLFTLGSPNTPLLSASLGVLSATGTATATFNLPPGADPLLVLAQGHHAGIVLGSSGAVVEVTEAVPVLFTIL